MSSPSTITAPAEAAVGIIWFWECRGGSNIPTEGECQCQGIARELARVSGYPDQLYLSPACRKKETQFTKILRRGFESIEGEVEGKINTAYISGLHFMW